MSGGLFRKDQGSGAGGMYCAKCGHPVHRDAKFCAACGTSVPLRVCGTCAASNGPQAKYCAKCGQPLAAVPAVPMPATPTAAVAAPSLVQPQGASATVSPIVVEIESPSKAVTPEPELAPIPPPRTAPPVPEPLVVRPAVAHHVANEPPGARTPAAASAARSARNRNLLVLAVGAIVAAFVAGATGYAYWTGIIGDRPGSVAREVTGALKKAGFDNVTVAMGKDWVAQVSGVVVGQDRKQALEATLGGRSEIAGTSFDALEVRPSQDEIRAEIAKTLAANRLGHITAEVDGNGAVTLLGRAEREGEIGSATDIVMSVPGVSAVEPRVSQPFSVVERSINLALRESGFTGVRASLLRIDDMAVSGSLREEADRAAVIAKVVQTANALGEAIDASSVRDEMTIVAPVVVAPLPQQPDDAQSATAATAAFESAEPVAAAPPIVGVWSGNIRWGIVGSNAAFWLDGATVGENAGRSEYSGSYLYCRGSLRLVEVSGNEYTFDETITEKNPRATCPGSGLVKMVLSSSSSADVKWIRGNKLSAVRYKGSLLKR